MSEYTTLSLVQAELRTTTDFSSSTLPTKSDVSNWIVEESGDIDRLGGRVYSIAPYTETFDYNGTDVLVLKNAPVTSVTSVLYSTSALGTDTYSLSDTKTEDTDYTVYLDEGEIEFLSNWSPAEGRKRIKVNYLAGYSQVPTYIQKLATKKVTKRVLDTLLNKDVNEKKSGKSISVGSISIVKPADFGVSQYKVLSSEIAELEKEILDGSSLYRIPLNRY